MKKITNISSVVIPFRRIDPSQIFVEIKDKSHPLVLVRGGLCPIGGNWIGANAVGDESPLYTVRREVTEEMTVAKDRKAVSTQELVELGLAETAAEYVTTGSAQTDEAADRARLEYVVGTIAASMCPFGSYLNTVTSEAIQGAEPGSKREGFTTLACYWVAPLDEKSWEVLTQLQAKFGNLSNESVSMVTSLGEILQKNLSGAFAHEQVLRDFFESFGLTEAKKIRIVGGQTSEFAGPILGSYANYLEKYDIEKKPSPA